MGLTQTKLHWYVLGQDWKGCTRRIHKSQGAEARTFNPYGDLPIHLACYDGAAPPEIIRALIDAYPDSVRKENKRGRDPLELAARNYHLGSPHRAEVLALLRWHRPENSPPSNSGPANESLPGIFSNNPPEQMYSASARCVVCMEEPSSVAMIPCGHICLCMKCVPTCMRNGRCPIDRCEVHGLYQLQGDQVRIHESMCGVCNDDYGGTQREMEIAC
mmetsp:Transcript_14706/g.35431  ORF Transcript_14706/g.35431 Transcript_14706/m.35431 type:complete len:217 (+) Transcript_14706:128-778(+)